MADESKPRTRFEMIMAYLRSLKNSKEEEPKKKKKGEKSIAELINFGGDYEERSEGGVLVGEDTGKTVEKTGRTVYKTEEGHDVSELSVTFKYKDKWINIPSIVMGEELTEDELRELLDEGLIKPTSTHDNLKEAEKAAKEHSKSLKFNKGGTSMDEQMKMFGEGGLLDEGGEVDEESGNDVPIGGTKEGVRDDIPAMLSEGEFVFPEDVTRYHGLEKLMTLRQEAKMGLKKMEAMGQMGNSEEATIPDDLPFTMDDLILVVGEEKSDKKDDEPIKAQQGTFVPSQQNLANQGIMGTQQSIYQQPNTVQPAAPLTVPASSLVPANTAPVGGYTAPTVLAAPATGYSPLYATEPVPTVATKVDEPDFVPDVSSEYKPVKYINPTTGDTMMINEYQGNPVSAVPAGYIRHSDFIAQGGTDTETTDTTTDTGVETAQVATGGRSTDDEKRENEKLFDTLKTKAERKRVETFNNLLTEGSEEWNNDPDGTKLIEEYKKAKTGQGLAALLPGIGLPASLLARKNVKNIEAAMVQKFGETLAKEKIKEIGILSSAKDTIGGIGKGITDTFFTKGGLDKYNKNYEAQFSLEDFSKARGKPSVQGYIKGLSGNNLTSIQQQQFDMAIRNGDMAAARHYELIAQGNAARDEFAKENAADIRLAQKGGIQGAAAKKRLEQTLNKGFTGSTGMSIGMSSLDSIIEYGGGVATAINDGRAKAGGTFKKAEVVDKISVAGEKGSIETASNTKDKGPSLADQLAAKKAEEEKQKQIRLGLEADEREKRRRESERKERAAERRKERQERQKKADKFTKSKIADYKKTGRVTGFKKGGLMEKDK